jgi:phage/plasmid-associated DNA primase
MTDALTAGAARDWRAARDRREARERGERDAQEGIPPFSDEALALRFAARHADDLQYVAAWSKWLQWTGAYWRPDDTKLAFDLSRKVCREAAAEANKSKIASGLASAKTVAAVARLYLLQDDQDLTRRNIIDRS